METTRAGVRIVRKLQARPMAPARASGGGPPGGGLVYRVRASMPGIGPKKCAEVWAENDDGSPRTSRWAILCDEGTHLGGGDTAPSPLSYFSAGLALSLLTQIYQSSRALKVNITDVRIDQTIHFFRDGSVQGRTAQSGSLGVELDIQIECDEPPDRVLLLVAAAKAASFAHGAVSAAVPVKERIRHNGEWLGS